MKSVKLQQVSICLRNPLSKFAFRRVYTLSNNLFNGGTETIFLYRYQVLQTRNLDRRKIDNIYDTVVKTIISYIKGRHRTLVVINSKLSNWTKFTTINKTLKMKSVVALTLAVFCLSMVSTYAHFVPTLWPVANKNLDFVWSRNFLFDLILLLLSVSENNKSNNNNNNKFYVEKLFYFFITFCSSNNILLFFPYWMRCSVVALFRFSVSLSRKLLVTRWRRLLRLINSLVSLFLQCYMDETYRLRETIFHIKRNCQTWDSRFFPS